MKTTNIKKKKPSKKKDFFDKVYDVVAQIPYGKVATYGDIAEACGIRSSARTVGWALNSSKGSNLPCHRVVNRFGALTGKMHFGSYDMMEELLLSEGIKFDKDSCVILEDFLWKPGDKKVKRKK